MVMVGIGGRVLGSASVLHQGHISTVAINGVGHGLQPAVRESHKVLAISVGTRPALLVAKVVVGGSVVHSILPHILCISLN